MISKTTALVLFLAVCAAGQTYSIEGVVADPDGRPLTEVHVTLIPGWRTTLSNENGRFVFPDLAAGNYSLRLQYIGFETETVENVTVVNQAVDLGTVRLTVRVLEAVEDVVVTATRSQQRSYNLAEAVNIVSRREIAERNAKTSAEALREEPGIAVQKTNHGGGSAIIRGFSSNQILILVDGVRLNNSTFRLGNHQYLTTVDNQMLERIEVVRGPTSVLYGSDAMGGTVNLITRLPATGGNSIHVRRRLLTRLASADQEKTVRAEISLHGNRFAFQSGFSSKNTGDLRRGTSSRHRELENSTNGLMQTPSGFASQDFDSKLVYRPSAMSRVIVAYQTSRQQNVPRYDKYENDSYQLWVYHPQRRDLAYLVYDRQIDGRFINAFKTTVSSHRQAEGREIQKSIHSSLTREKDDVLTYGFAAQMNAAFPKHQIIFGTELYADQVSSTRTMDDGETELRGRYPDGATYSSMGFYLQDEISISNRLTSRVGLRSSSHSARFPQSEADDLFFNEEYSQTFTALTGSITSIFRLDDNVSANFNVAQSFRAPNLSDLAKLGESKGDIYEIPNAQLKPERVINYEAGIKFFGSRIRSSVSAFYSAITDLITSADALYLGESTINLDGETYRIKSKQNSGRAFIRGLEASADFQLTDSIILRTNITSCYGHNSSAGEPVGGIPPAFGLVGIRRNFHRFHLDGFARFAGKQSRLSSDDLDDPRIPQGGTPAWVTINARGGLDISSSLSVQMALENVTDLNYREHGSGINGPGRNFIITLQWRN